MSKAAAQVVGQSHEARGAAKRGDTEAWKEGREDLGGPRQCPFRPQPGLPEERERDGRPQRRAATATGQSPGGPHGPWSVGVPPK